jgi:nitrite reductase/ring-hydroxylating ferredoxin subunit
LSGDELSDLKQRWFPICGHRDLPARHIFETELLGQEVAVWRDLNGHVNIWENRCPHRGMRLTVGANVGTELRCAYHGYRFAGGSGLCTSIPAQPGRAPPRSLCAKVYPTLERENLIWTRLSAGAADSNVTVSNDKPTTTLYSVAVKSTATHVGSLLANYKFRPSAALTAPADEDEYCSITCLDEFSFHCVAARNSMTTEVRLYTQPVDAQCTVIHGVLLGEIPAKLLIPTLKHHAQQFIRLRAAAERLAQSFGARVLTDLNRQ